MQTLTLPTTRPILGMGRASRCTRLACRAQLPSKSEACLQSTSLDKATLALAASLLPFTALPALAEEASPAAEAVEAVTSAGPTILGFTPFGLGLAFSPVLLYGLFYLYRENVNPKAKLSDLFFFVAAAVIIGNIVSILVFKRRIY